MLEKVFNARLASHPLNWLIVFAFVSIWGFVAMLADDASKGGCGCDNGIPD